MTCARSKKVTSETVRFIQATLEPTLAPCVLREQQFERLGDRLRFSDDPVEQHMGKVMACFRRGLFVGGDDADQLLRDQSRLGTLVSVSRRGTNVTFMDTKHAGIRIVQEESDPGACPGCASAPSRPADFRRTPALPARQATRFAGSGHHPSQSHAPRPFRKSTPALAGAT